MINRRKGRAHHILAFLFEVQKLFSPVNHRCDTTGQNVWKHRSNCQHDTYTLEILNEKSSGLRICQETCSKKTRIVSSHNTLQLFVHYAHDGSRLRPEVREEGEFQVSKSINTSSVAPYYIDGQLRAQKRHVYTHDSDFWKKLPVDFKQNIGS
jgi:hypothetical protein